MNSTAQTSLRTHLAAIIVWAIDAAREHVEIAAHCGDDIDPAPGAGLRRNFDAAFPAAQPVDYDLCLSVYSETVKAIAAVTAAQGSHQ